MVDIHDFNKFPELSNKQIEEFGFQSPHKQITEDFEADVIKVIDGDTIRLRTNFRDFDFPMRFLEIDAPELNAGGEEAKEWLKNRIEGKTVKILINIKNRVDKFGRLLGKVFHGGLDVGNEELILGLVKTFANRREAQLPILSKIFSIKQWL